ATKMQDAANRLLQVNPNAVRALALMAYTKRAAVEANPNSPTVQQDSQQALQFGQKGLAALQCFTKPAGTPATEFETQKNQVAAAATQTAPPAGFTVTPAPTPAQQAAKLAQTKDPKTMDFADLETVFGNAEPAVSQQVLTAIKGQPMQPFAAKVIQATPTQLS